MRTYGQYCPLAKTLDVIGDRWSLLIVRELLIRGPCRYTDIRYGLPGVATNLLADRLRELEKAGVIRREVAPRPVAATLYHLTPRGEELRPIMRTMALWGLPFLRDAPDDDVFRSHWLASPVGWRDRTPDQPSVTIAVHTGEEPIIIETVDGRVRARPGSAEAPDAVITGSPRLVIGLLVGQIDLDEARAQGLRYEGDPVILSRVQPKALTRSEVGA
jgi:DNA-binding HxlR family transcriptional regulator